MLNLDLEEFFPSFNFGRVRGFFIKNRDFALHEKVATVIAQIACHDNALPQGSPCSPVTRALFVTRVRSSVTTRFIKCQSASPVSPSQATWEA